MMFSIAGFLFIVEIFGHTAGGAQSWIRLGRASIQPAEFAKTRDDYLSFCHLWKKTRSN